MDQLKVNLLGTALVALSMNLGAVESGDVLKHVDPFIGTGFHGHTFPGATAPFGMVQLSPDTRTSGWDACGGYYHDDTEIWGFSHTHLSGTGIGDYGDVRFSLGRPLFPEARVHLPNGKTFLVQMRSGDPKHLYVQRVTLNGKALTAPFINYADIMAGGELVFEMGHQKTVFWKNL